MAKLIEKLARELKKEEHVEAAINLAAIPVAGFVSGKGLKRLSHSGMKNVERIATHTPEELNRFVKKISKHKLGGELPEMLIHKDVGPHSKFLYPKTGRSGAVMSIPRMDILAHEMGHARQFYKGKIGKGTRTMLSVVASEVGASARGLKYIYQYGGKGGILKRLGRTAKGVPALAYGLGSYLAPVLFPIAIIGGASKQIISDLKRAAKEAKEPGNK